MGYYSGGRCHVSLASAKDAFFAPVPPDVVYVPPSSPSVLAKTYTTFFEFKVGDWYLTQTVTSGGAPTVVYSTLASVPGFPSCDPAEAFLDGQLLGWGVVLLMVVAWGYKEIRKQAK